MPSKDVFLKTLQETLPAWRSNGGGMVDTREHAWVKKVIEL